MDTAIDVNLALAIICTRLASAITVSPSGKNTLELLNYSIKILKPELSICTLKSRNLNYNYIEKELDWYKSGDLNIEKISPYAKIWKEICDEKGYINSNYGYYIFKELTINGLSQFDFVIKTLEDDKDSRQAIININRLEHKDGSKDFPCTISLQFFIRNNCLHMITNMRSNDVIYGFCNDVPFFTWIQMEILNSLKVKYPNISLGAYYHNANSMHIYEKHYHLINLITSEWYKERLPAITLKEMIRHNHETEEENK